LALEKEGINTDIAQGNDATGIWKNHFFLLYEDIIIDPTPLYPKIGAQHIIRYILNITQIYEYSRMCNIPAINVDYPIQFYKEIQGLTWITISDIDYGKPILRHKVKDYNKPSMWLERIFSDEEYTENYSDNCPKTLFEILDSERTLIKRIQNSLRNN
jgi:hypothetical protein